MPKNLSEFLCPFSSSTLLFSISNSTKFLQEEMADQTQIQLQNLFQCIDNKTRHLSLLLL